MEYIQMISDIENSSSSKGLKKSDLKLMEGQLHQLSTIKMEMEKLFLKDCQCQKDLLSWKHYTAPTRQMTHEKVGQRKFFLARHGKRHKKTRQGVQSMPRKQPK